jgi:hypothetical protein
MQTEKETAKQIAESDRNWYEDYSYENGQYFHICIYCKKQFIGYKRRVVCKKCSITADVIYEYSIWLTKNGYMDTDWKDEEPFAIDEFMKTLRYENRERKNNKHN